MVAINPDSGKVEGASFTVGDESQMALLIEARQGRANLYFHVNRLRNGFKGPKAKKEDVAEATHLHTDVDNTADDKPILQFDPPPTATLFSGVGFQSFWQLKTSTTDHLRVEASNLAIASRLGGDNCHNIDRIMRTRPPTP